jgi:hypothetical protein
MEAELANRLFDVDGASPNHFFCDFFLTSTVLV